MYSHDDMQEDIERCVSALQIRYGHPGLLKLADAVGLALTTAYSPPADRRPNHLSLVGP